MVFHDMWTWLSRLGSHRSEILHCSFKTWHDKSWTVTLLQLHATKSWQWLQHSRLGFPSLDTFWVKDFPYETFSKIDFFHDLVFQDMNTIGFVFKPRQPPQFVKYTYIYIYMFQNLAYQVLKCFILCNSMSQVFTMIALFKTCDCQVLNPVWGFYFHIRPN